jgi:hypothetical protein
MMYWFGKQEPPVPVAPTATEVVAATGKAPLNMLDG